MKFHFNQPSKQGRDPIYCVPTVFTSGERNAYTPHVSANQQPCSSEHGRTQGDAPTPLAAHRWKIGIIFIKLFSLLALLILSACGTTISHNTSTLSPTATSTPVIIKQPNTTPAVKTIGIFRAYALPQAQSGIMRPAIDHKGRIWFGEMGHNALAVFDPHTGLVQQMVPPHGADGIMGITVATDDSIWFAEEYANYIGHYFPDTHQFKIYMLPTITTTNPSDPHKILTLPLGPNDITLDAHGNVWFTETNADSLGMLNVQTGLFKHYPLTPHKSVQNLDPYGITIDPIGNIWFTESALSLIGRLDPHTGVIRTFTTRNAAALLMEVASDSHGNIWATSFSSGLLVKFAPSTGTFTYYYTPYTGSTPGGLYGLTITPQDEVWLTVTGENTIARLDPSANRFLYYAIPTPGSSPFGLVVDAHHTVWFTAAGNDEIGMLQP
jgi:virginiamycin B lyase